MWIGSSFQWDVRNQGALNMKEWIDSRLSIIKHKRNHDVDGQVVLFLNLLWSIWLARNSLVF